MDAKRVKEAEERMKKAVDTIRHEIATIRTSKATTSLLDGIKVHERRGWAHVLPDPDEPIVHVYAEGETPADAGRLEEEFLALVEEIVAGAEDEALA